MLGLKVLHFHVRYFDLFITVYCKSITLLLMSSLCSDPVVVPVESEEEKGEHSDPEKEEDVGITFVARKAETPKQRPKSGEMMNTIWCG